MTGSIRAMAGKSLGFSPRSDSSAAPPVDQVRIFPAPPPSICVFLCWALASFVCVRARARVSRDTGVCRRGPACELGACGFFRALELRAMGELSRPSDCSFLGVGRAVMGWCPSRNPL
ncbi:hypothetical protein NL676_013356 [Syzygium grande]|nr:hypothetical protein NL676_013356 [Syzygium grande]